MAKKKSSYFNYYYDYDDLYDDMVEIDSKVLKDYRTPPGARVIEKPRAASQRGQIGVQWWGQQWVAAMERLGLDGRLQRGRTYARNGSVLRLEISAGLAYAEVQGSQHKPYRTAVRLKPMNDEEWEQALTALAGQAIYAAKLLAGEMPGDIEGLFAGLQMSLFPRSQKDIQFECSCPDWGDPCKHAAAVYYLVAEQLDADPFILFHLRGCSRDEVLTALRRLRGMSEDQPTEDTAQTESVSLDADLGAFWGTEQIALVRALPNFALSPFALRQLGKPPEASAEFEIVYQQVTAEARRWLGLDE